MTSPSAPARAFVHAELDELAAKRRRALLLAGVILVGAVLVSGLFVRPVGLRAVIASVAISVAVAASLGVALGVPMVSARTARLVALASTVLAVGGGVLLGGAFVPGAALGMSCFFQGILAGVLGVVALSLSMGRLWRRSIDVRWPASLGATAVVLAVGASVCSHEDGLHMWVAHLPVIPAAYALVWAGSRVVRRGGGLS